MQTKRHPLLRLALLCVLVTSTLLLPATVVAAPTPPGRAYAASTGGGTAWVTAGPEAQLWVAGASNQTAHLAFQGQRSHFGAPVWSPDGAQVAVLVMPTGTETASLGEWWTVDVASGNPAQRAAVPPAWTGAPARQASKASTPAAGKPQELPLPPVGEIGPAVVPFALNAAQALTPPATIRVKHTAQYNTCRSYLADGTVTVLNFEDYVAMVVPHEAISYWKPAALQAQAIASRTYAWYKILENKTDYDVTDGPDTQHMCDDRYASTDAAVAATAGQYLSYNGLPILAQYSAENSHPTLDGSTPYLKAVLDPVGLGHTRYGHGHGLSQWGAQRWALSGWSAVQILTHYYTGVLVVDPVHQDPLLALTTPWSGAWVNDDARPGTWLTGATAYLSAYANPEWAPAVSFTAPGFSAQDSNPADGWSASYPVSGNPSGSITIGAATVTRTATLSLSGVDRTIPTGQMSLPSATGSQTVTVNLTASDQGGSAVASVALGGDWQLRADDFSSVGGSTGGVSIDAAASTGIALRLPAGASTTWQASFVEPLALNQPFRAFVRLSYQSPSQDAGQVARIELWDPYKTAPVGWVNVRAGDFRGQGSYQEFPIDFWLTDNGKPNQNQRLFARITATGSAEVFLDRILVLEEPQAYASQTPYVLEPRVGAQTVVAKILDGAGNSSADLTGSTTWTTSSQTSEWQLISPTGWVKSTNYPEVVARVTGDINALVAPCVSPPSTNCASVRYSTDGGMTWSGWVDITPTRVSDTVSELRYTWPGVQGGSTNRIQFWVGSTTGADSVGPRWRVPVDTQAPGQGTVASTIAPVGRPFYVTLSAGDNVEVVAFDVQDSTDGTTWNNWLSRVSANRVQHPALTANPMYIRTRAIDAAGNVGPWSAGRAVYQAAHEAFLPLTLR